MQPIRFAIVGYGFIGHRHGEILMGHPDCELVAVCDTAPSARERVAMIEVPFFDSLDALLASEPEVDVMTICTPNGLHALQATQILNAGYHVVIEKPMGLRRAECEEVLHTALQKSRQAFVVMQNRYSPTSVWLKELIDAGRMGQIHTVQVNCYWNRDDFYYKFSKWKGSLHLDGGPLFTQFSHFVDILYWLFGDVKEISGRFGNFMHLKNTQFEDSGFVHFAFERGGIGSINYSTAAWDQNFESSITILGEKGTVRVGGQYMERIEYCHIENYHAPDLPEANPPNDYGVYQGSAANHHFVFENVVQTLRGDSSITTNALEGLKVVDIIERIYAER